MLKKDLRLQYTALRKDVSPHSLLNSSLSIANKLLALDIWHFDYYHIFLPITSKNEVDTSFILSILQGKDKNIVLPKVKAERSLKHILLTDNTKLMVNSWGVPEPLDGIEVPIEKIDVVFVPLLAFDKTGNRVGYGKGFYDVFLSNCRKDVIKIGLSLFTVEDKITDVSENDIPLDHCVTPEEIYSFSRI
ncbi:5-formyltetrahydrofolate cyclo-ligase [Maribacter sp. 2308TA10-17]|uniref:5-formyltetrahydrofolate cyclo-ligase n=1 Tax=Maribacter sp. 2308TA10-17 TaxID=3386276 RepID=UPI0039BCDB6B